MRPWTLVRKKKSPLTQVIWEDQSGRKQRPEQLVDRIELSNDPPMLTVGSW